MNKIKSNSIAITLCDININLLDADNEHTSSYLNCYLENNFIPCITLPTRIKGNSATLIDHIFIKIPPKLIHNKCSAGNLITDISDHLPNFVLFDLKTPLIKKDPILDFLLKKTRIYLLKIFLMKHL